jgi:hypothetical protein
VIEFLHSAPYLYREDAYRDYCWAVDAWGAQQPSSFIYLCSEAFATFCAEVGIHIVPSSHNLGLAQKDAFPTKAEENSVSPTQPELDGLIIRITSERDLSLIRRYLDLGRNVLLLLPNEETALFSRPDKGSILTAAANVLSALNAAEFANRLDPSLYNRRNIWWNEAPQVSGRLFLTEDHFISDGLFMDGYGKSPENSAKLYDLRRELGVFRGKFLTIGLRNSIRFWPCHEPITLLSDVQNWGPPLDEIPLSVELPERFEPLGATEFILPHMVSLAKTSMALQVIPRLDGEYRELFTVTSVDSSLRIKARSIPLTITPSYTTQMRVQSRKDSPGLERLKRVVASGTQWLDIETLRNLEELAVIDPAACLNKIRSVAERLAQRCTKRPSLNFASQIKELQDRNLLSKKAVGYLHTIRVLGNLASHPSGEIITLDDVRIAAFALSCVIEEVLDKLGT